MEFGSGFEVRVKTLFYLRKQNLRHDAGPAFVDGVFCFRGDGDDVDPPFLAFLGDQSLYVLSLDEFVPVFPAFDVALHEAGDGELDRFGEEAVPASGVDAVQSGPAAQRQGSGLFGAAAPGQEGCSVFELYRQYRGGVGEDLADVRAQVVIVDTFTHG